MKKIGMVKVAAAAPIMKVANAPYNGEQIIEIIREAEENGAGIVVFPELAVTGCTCGDLFFQNFLYQQSIDTLKKIINDTKSFDITTIIGFYLNIEGRYYSCSGLIQKGIIHGIVPKLLTRSGANSDSDRWFASGEEIINKIDSVYLFDYEIPFGNILFKDKENNVNLGIEVGSDALSPIPPSAFLAENGAEIIFNPSSLSETAGTSQKRACAVSRHSAKIQSAYVMVTPGVYESSTDLVYSGDSIFAELGDVIARSSRFKRENNITYTDIDYKRIQFNRASERFSKANVGYGTGFIEVEVPALKVINIKKDTLSRTYSRTPFIPEDKDELAEYCEEVFNIQVAALAKRLDHTYSDKLVIGVSGGLDSTLALLVCTETFRLLNRDFKKIVTITMPGFGTTDKTYKNAMDTMKLLGTDLREIPIKDAVLQHFSDIGHDPSIHDVAYENAQARERTQILMDIANKEKGIHIGTGDLSEVALGWCTYNGDHMAMYDVNGAVPKTLIPYLIKWLIDQKRYDTEIQEQLSITLHDIIETPISPELLPPNEDGTMQQKTEDTVGPYILHDFFLHHFITSGAEPEKLLYLATTTFERDYSKDDIKKFLDVFHRRFFSQQFKRNCSPDGPKATHISLSPRGGLVMASDTDGTLWQDK